MKIGLNVPERLVLLTILPKEGSFVTIKMVRDLVNKVGLSSGEIKEFNVTDNNGMVKWNKKGNDPKEIEFDYKEIEMVSNQLKNLDNNKKLEQKHFTLYQKFIIDQLKNNGE